MSHPIPTRRFSLRSRRGLTLVELLVVVTILMILLGVVLPLASPSLNSRKMREAARQVNTAFASAKARAQASGRPAGVILYPSSKDPNKCFSLAFAKSPAQFSGATDEATVQLSIPEPQNPSLFALAMQTKPGVADSVSAQQLGHLMGGNVAFLIRFNHQGRWHVGQRNPNTGALSVTADVGSEASLGQLGNVPYQISLPPKRSAAAGIDLPVGVHIAMPSALLHLENVDYGDASDTNLPSAIMIDKENGLGHVYRGTSVRRVTGPAIFLIVDSEIWDRNANEILTPEAGSLWVTVDNKTGQAKTAKNLGSDLNQDGNWDRILPMTPPGPNHYLLADLDADGSPDDVNSDGTLDDRDALAIARNAISESKAGGR